MKIQNYLKNFKKQELVLLPQIKLGEVHQKEKLFIVELEQSLMLMQSIISILVRCVERNSNLIPYILVQNQKDIQSIVILIVGKELGKDVKEESILEIKELSEEFHFSIFLEG